MQKGGEVNGIPSKAAKVQRMTARCGACGTNWRQWINGETHLTCPYCDSCGTLVKSGGLAYLDLNPADAEWRR